VLRLLVIAAEFKDLNHTVTTDQIKQTFSGPVSNYYKQVSYGAVTLQVDVFGWYRLPLPESSYGMDCVAVDDPDCSGQDASWGIARDAVLLAQKDVNIDNYDSYAFVHSGTGEESSKVKVDVWSVTYLGGVYVPTATKTLTRFTIIPETEAQGAVTNGVYTHELGHLLFGLPDLYNTNTGRTILGPWSLMDKGLWNGNPPGSSPAYMEAWSKIKLGWINGSMLGVASSGGFSNYTIFPTETASSGVHAIEIPISGSPPTRYYLVEVRDRIGYDSALPAFGVLITYVDENLFLGKVTIVDGHPNVPGLEDATWNVGQTFIDPKTNLEVAITNQTGNAFQVTVDRRAPLPDLTVSKIYTQPAVVKPNLTVTILIDITNQGTLAASNVPLEIDLDGQLFANQQTSVGAGQTTEISVTWTAVAGTHLIKVTIDPQGTLQELNKANNIATFTLNVGPTLIITVPLDLTTGNATAWVIINGVQYYANNSQVIASVPIGTVSVEIEPGLNTTAGVRQSFTKWSDGDSHNPRQITITSDTALTALFKTQYLLTVNSNQGTTTPTGWYDANSVAAISATSPSNMIEHASRQVFLDWSGDVNSNSSSVTVNVTKPLAVNANWKTQYYVMIMSSVGDAFGGGWYDAGETATISVRSTVQLENRTRQVFIDWNGTAQGQGPVAKFRVNAPSVIQATWKTQYLVQIESPYGDPQGSGWYDAGSSAQISIQPKVDYGNRTRRLFEGWAGDYSGTNNEVILRLDSPKTMVAKWITQYELRFEVTGISNSTYVKLTLDNSNHDVSVNNVYQDWFDQGRQITPTVNETISNGIFIYRFLGWYNSIGAAFQGPISVNGPQDYVASYSNAVILPPIPGFPLESILAGLMLGLLALTVCKRRRRASIHRPTE
jgi:M6 family metalloprotease-like protein